MYTTLKVGLVALIGFGLAVTLNAFTEVKPKTGFSYWQYDSGNVTDIRTGSSYTKISVPAEAPCDEGSELPCVLKVDESIATDTDLNTYLHNTSLFPDAASITNAAMYQKDAD